MANYPELPFFVTLETPELLRMYTEIQRYAAILKMELETRDTEVRNAVSTRIYAVATTTDIARPFNGSIALATSTGKYRGYVSGTGWVDFN
jgi:hypothetical protein